MQHSELPKKQLGIAKYEIEAMRASTSLDEFEDHWREFLHRLERAWNKAVAHFGKSPK